jgi:hypothetical protein
MPAEEIIKAENLFRFVKSKVCLPHIMGRYSKNFKPLDGDILEQIPNSLSFKRRCSITKKCRKKEDRSLWMSPKKNAWCCFSCNKGGDQISYVSQIKNISPNEAIKDIASVFGLDLTELKGDGCRSKSIFFSCKG